MMTAPDLDHGTVDAPTAPPATYIGQPFNFTPQPLTPTSTWFDRFINRNGKALGTFLVGMQSWGGVVVASKSAAITGPEWLGLLGVVLATLTAYGVTNS